MQKISDQMLTGMPGVQYAEFLHEGKFDFFRVVPQMFEGSHALGGGMSMYTTYERLISHRTTNTKFCL